MNLSPLQLDTNCFNVPSHYHSSYYTPSPSEWSLSSSSLLCPSATAQYPRSTMPSALQPIENYCPVEPFYPSGSDPTASSSDPSLCLPSSHYPSIVYPNDEFINPSSSSSAMMLPQNRANYTRHQLVMLNEIFQQHKYPNSLQKTLIAKYIGVSRDQIRIWFQNKRRKVQLITKGQARQTKTDVECEHGEYRRHLPKNFLGDLFQELHRARGAPARLPVKRDNATKAYNVEQQEQQLYYPMTNSAHYFPANQMIEYEDSSQEQNDETYRISYAPPMY